MIDELHNELSAFYDPLNEFLDDSGFYELEGKYDPAKFYAEIPPKIKDKYESESQKKNSRVWDILKAVLIGAAIGRGVRQFRKEYPREVAKAESRDEALPANKKRIRSVNDYANEYIKSHGGEFIKNMTRSDQQRLVNFIWSNSARNERPLARDIKNLPHIQSIIDSGKHRTETIIRTERHRAINYGSWMHAGDIGAQTKTRHELFDARTRPSHRAMRDMTVLLDEPYPNGEMYPGSIDLNCRGSQSYNFDRSNLTKNANSVYGKKLAQAEKLVEAGV